MNEGGATTTRVLGSPESNRRSKRREGFANVAQWVSRDPDGETSVYRKFGELAARNLLYLQAELLVLEKRLDDLDDEDADPDGDMDAKDAARTFEVLMQRSDDHPSARVRTALVAEIRAKLKEYHETLLLQSEVVKLKRPGRRVLDAYRQWFKRPYPALGGLSKTFLDDASDLVSLDVTSETDYLSLFLRRHWPAEEEISRDGRHRIGRFKEQSVSIAVAVVSTAVAAGLLIGPIVGLSGVTSNNAKLAMIAIFTAAFALSVGFVTSASRAEIFGATAAYAAVLVVFVSGNISSPSS